MSCAAGRGAEPRLSDDGAQWSLSFGDKLGKKTRIADAHRKLRDELAQLGGQLGRPRLGDRHLTSST